MKNCEWNIQLLCNGRTLIEGDLDKLYTLSKIHVRALHYDDEGFIKLKITRSKVEKYSRRDPSNLAKAKSIVNALKAKKRKK